MKDLPGPKGSVLVGNLLQLDVPKFHLQLEEWAKTHGSIYHLRLAHREHIVVSDMEAGFAMMKARPEVWIRPTNIADAAREDGFIGLFAAEGEDWKRQRRLVMTAFDPEHLRSYFPQILRITERLHRKWTGRAQSGSPFDVRRELMKYTVDAAAVLSYGEDLNTLEDESSTLQRHLAAVFPMIFKRILIPFAYWRYVRLPADREYDEHVAEVRKEIARITREAREKLARSPEHRAKPTNLLEAMMVAKDEDGSALTDIDIAGNVFTMLLASQDTTANSIAWTIELLYRHPAAWIRLVEEAHRVLGDVKMPQGLDEVHALPYAQACANESMRLKPAAPIMALEAAQDTVVAGYSIPKGVRAYVLPRPAAVNHEGLKDPLMFLPERWLGEDGHEAFPRRISTPFGAGPRICPGRYLALIEMTMVLTMLARNFEITRLETKDGKPPQELMAFTMCPTDFSCQLSPA